MKKLISQWIKALTLVIMLLLANVVSGQNFTLSVQNLIQTAPNKLDFDVYLLNTNSAQPFELAGIQLGFLFNSLIYTGGTVTAAINNTGSGLNAAQQFIQSANNVVSSLAGFPNQTLVRQAGRTPPGPGAGTIISTVGPGTLITHFTLTSTVNFTASTTPDLTFTSTSSLSPLYATVIAEYIGTTNTQLTVTAGSNAIVNGNPVLNAPSLPTAFAVTGGGSFCQGAAGLPVGVTNSEVGVTYTLFQNSIAQVPTVAGTGAAISFGNQPAGTYTVSGTNLNGTTPMTGSAVLIQTTIVPTLTGLNSVCVGTTGVVYTTETGKTNYVWGITGGTITAGGTTTSNTATVTWNTAGAESITVYYTDLGCTPPTPTLYPVTVNALPVPTIAGTNSVCTGTTGVVYTTETGKSNYAWTISAGGTITSGGTSTSNTATVTWNTAGAQSISVNYTNGSCTAISPASLAVTVGTSFSPSLTGNNTPCIGSTGNIYTTDPGMTNYAWTISAGGTITSGGTSTSNTVTVTWSTAGAQSVTVDYTKAGCTGTPTIYPVSVQNNVTTPVFSIGATSSRCQGAGTVTYTATASNTTGITYSLDAASITGGNSIVAGTGAVTYVAGWSGISVITASAAGCTGPITATHTVTTTAIPTITGTTPGSVCGTGTVTLGATASAGTINWYAAATGGLSLGTGVTFTTPSISTTTTYYVDATSGTCTTASRTAVVATVNAIPTIAGTTPGSVCGSGTVTLGATASAGTINWYAAATGGVSLGTGTSFTTPSISATTTYYVDATSGTCTTASRTAVIATVNAIPTITGTTPGSVCGSGTVTLGATASAGTINWYAGLTGGVSLGTGSSFTTPTLFATTTYYVDATSGTCTTASRTAVVATVNPDPTIATTTPGSVCGTGTVTLGATASAGTINWYAAATGGASLGTGTSFTTPSISATTTYYVDATNGTCTTASRTAVVATVNTIPTITGTTPGSVCGSGTVTLGATASAGTINWYAAASGGASLGTGISFTTPSISVTTTYYVDATLGTCTTASRSAVVATVNPLPTVAGITGTAAVCAGSTTQLADITAAGVWSSATPGVATINSSGLVSGVTAGTSLISYTVTSGGCSNAANLLVTVNARPVPTLTGLTSVCAGSTGDVYTTETGMSNYLWTVSAGGTITAGGTATSNSVTVTWNTAGAQTVTVSYTNASSCTPVVPTSLPVTVGSVVTPTLTGLNSVCAGSTGVIYTTDASKTNYIWTITGGTITAGGTTSSNTATVTWNTIGAQSISVDYTPSGGCLSNVTNLPVTVNAIPTITGTTPGSVCGSGTVTLGATASAGTINWYAAATGGVSLGTGASFTTPSISATTTYYVDATVGSCSSSSRTAVVATVNAIPAIAGTTPGSVCGTGTVTLGATASAGTISWYAAATGGTSLGTGISFTTPSISATTTYYVDATAGTCTTASRTAVVATVNAIPTITGTTPGSVCGTGTVTLGATASAGTINWYAAATGGVSLGTGISFTTPTLSATTTYYVDATSGTCTTASRTAIVATVNPDPTITGTTPGSVCGSGTVTLGATASAGTINWYAALTGGVSLGTGISFTTPVISASTTYYVDATNGTCTTASRTAVVATVNAIPTISGTTPGSVCGTGTVTLGATASAGTINWYAAATGGVSLGTGISFTTPSLSVTTTYWVDATSGTCTTASRTAVVATVNAIPTITGTTPGSVCGTGTVTLGATASAGTINWYASATGGVTLGTGISFTTPSISATTTYYVDATLGSCTTASRTAAVATVNTIPTITGTTPGSVCSSGTVTLGATASAGTINWYAAATGGTSLGTGISFTTPSISATTTYYVDATLGTCTTASRTAIVATVNPLPTVAGITGTASVCAGSTTQLADITAAGVWSSATPGVATINSSGLVSGVTAGTSLISYTVTSGGCSNAATLLVTINARPVPTLTGLTSVCTGSTGDVYTTETGMSNYLWTVSAGGTITAGGTATSNSVTVTWNTAGAQTVTVSYTNASSCTPVVPTSLPVTVGSVVTPTLTGLNSVCAGSTGVIYTTDASKTNYIWTITGGTITAGGTTSSNTTTVTWNTIGAQSISVDYTPSGGCLSNVTNLPVTVNAIPTITGTTPGSVCGSGTVTLGATASAGTINWYAAATGGVSLGTGASFTTPSISATTTYYVDATVGSCSSSSRTAVVATVNAIPAITGTTPGSVCGTGTVTLGATTSAGTINWYAAATGGTSLGTGISFTTPSISATTTYYVDATAGTCTTASRTAVVATVNAIPTITGTTPGSVCGTGTVTLGATASAGTINWYAAATGGVSLGTGISFTTPTLSATTTYYVDATSGTCTTASRTAIVATVNAIPTITGTTPGSACGTNVVTLGATASAGTINWYTAATGGASLGTGTSFTTPFISATTTFYADATSGTCTTASRTAVVATINAIPTITGTTPGSVCGSGTVTLGATPSAGTINWYAAATGGVSLGAGTSFTTPSLSVTTTYWVDATNGGCTTLVRTAVVATVNPLPTVAGITGTAVVCAGSTTQLADITAAGVWSSATPAVATINSSGLVSGVTAGTSLISYTVTSGGCSNAATLLVTLNARPVPTLTGPNSVCTGSTGDVYTTETGMSNYLWTVSAGGTITAGGTATSNSVTVTWNTAGTQTVTVSYTNASSCTPVVPASLPVTVGSVVTPALTGLSSVCVGTTGVIYTTDASKTNYIWTITGGTITAGGTTSSNTATVTWNTIGAQSISVTYTPSGGCTSSVTNLPVTVNALPVVAAITGTPNVNVGSTTQLADLTAGGVWSSSTPLVATVNATGLVTGVAAGNSTISYTVTTGACSTVVTLIVNVASGGTVVTPGLTGSNSVCTGSSGVVYSTETGQTNYLWTVSAGGSITSGGSSTDNTMTITWNTAGSQSISVTYTPSGGGSASVTSYPVTVNPASIGGTISGVGGISYGSSTGTLTLSGQTGTIVKWQKMVGSGTWSDIANTATTFSEIPASAGTWQYRVLVQAGTCPAANSTSLSIVVAKVALTATADNKSRTYGAANPPLTISYSGFVLGENASSITVPSVSTTAVATSIPGSYPISLSGGSATNYSITLANGTITINKASITFTADNKTRDYQAANPPLTYVISGLQNGETQSVLDALPTIQTTATQTSNAGNYPITLSGGSDNCYNFVYQAGVLTVSKISQTITFTSIPASLLMTNSATIAATSTSGLTVSIESVYPQYATVSGNQLTGVARGTARLRAFNAGDQNYLSAEKFADVDITSTHRDILHLFTPNGDGFNDYWEIPDLASWGKCDVRVFNRWGKEVYANKDYDNRWDGTSNSEPLPSGPYYFIIKTENNGTVTGTLNLVR